MNKQNEPQRGGISLRVLLILAALFLLPAALLATAPQWWTDLGLLNGNAAEDYAALNQGQAKNFVLQAYNEMQAKLPGGAGTNLTAFVNSLTLTNANYNGVNLGQLKTLSKPFYDRLIQIGYTSHYPWTYPWSGTTNAQDYAMANIGQAKNLFSFDLSNYTGPSTNGLVLWLKADAGVTVDTNSNITTWNDQSGHTNNAVGITNSTTGRATVTTNSLNGQPVIHLPGTVYSYFSIPRNATLQLTNGVTLLSVIRPTSFSSSTILSKGPSYPPYGLSISNSLLAGTLSTSASSSGSKTLTSNTSFLTNQPYLLAQTYDGTTQTLYQAGQSVASSTTLSGNLSTNIAPLYLGYDPYYNGDIAEVLLYNRNLSSSELATAQGYLADKWGIYTSSANWSKSYSAAVQSLIATNQWTKTEADAYVNLSASVNNALPTDMVLWLKADAGVTLDSNSNITAWADQSIYGNNATASDTTDSTGRATVTANSLNNKPIVHFPGNYEDPLNITDSTTLQPSHSVTVITLIRPASNTTSSEGIAVKGTSSYMPYGLAISSGNFFAGMISTSATSSGTKILNTPSSYSPNQPYLLAQVYDGTTQSLYQAGQLVASSASLNGSLYYSATSGQPLSIGAGGSTTYYKGDVAEVLIYNRALSSSELSATQGYLANKWGVYAPNATWIQSYSGTVQTLIAANGWTKAQADAYVQFATTHPGLPSDMVLWLEADNGVATDSNGNITGWTDQSFYQNNAVATAPTATTGRATVTASALNSHPVVHFTGSSNGPLSVADSAVLRPATGVTILSIVRPVNNGYGGWFVSKDNTPIGYGLGIAGSSSFFTETLATGSATIQTLSTSSSYDNSAPYLVSQVYDGTTQSLYQGGQLTSSGTSVSGALYYQNGAYVPLYIGNIPNSGTQYQGDIAEVIVYGRALSNSELGIMQGYLADKWGVYAPTATWPQQYSVAEQALITANGWTKAQADAYAASH